MIFSDLHAHTTFCDGKNTPEEMVLAAIERGLKEIGLCVHSYTDFDNSYCIPKNRVEEFQKEMARLKVKYADKIKVLCGLEVDYYTTSQTDGYDYKLGSLHYFKIGDKFYSLDISIPGFIEMVQKEFGGDYLAVCEEYYRLLADVPRKTECDVIAHIDLITKFNEGNKLFDTSDPRYVKAYRECVDKLVTYGKPFEINTGAISRGYRTMPYPASDVLAYIKEKGGKMIISSDSHSKENIAFLFDKYAPLVD
jgi:histidinol-phosphatase (PHP family)